MSAGRVYGGETPEVRRARRRNQLIEAGIELFGTGGYRAATVRAICREAGVTDRYFYEEFANMEALFAAVYEECTGRIETAAIASVSAFIESQPEETSADAALLVKIAEAAFAAILTVVRDDPRVGKISWVEHQGISDGTWWLESMERMERFAQLLEDLMRALAPELMPEDVALVVYRRAMVGAISHVALMWSSLDSPERLEETASALARFVVAATTAKAP